MCNGCNVNVTPCNLCVSQYLGQCFLDSRSAFYTPLFTFTNRKLIICQMASFLASNPDFILVQWRNEGKQPTIVLYEMSSQASFSSSLSPLSFTSNPIKIPSATILKFHSRFHTWIQPFKISVPSLNSFLFQT